MFESVVLKGFGGVRFCKSPIKLSKFTVLIGPNDSAKTTLLMALFMFPFPWALVFASAKLPILRLSKPDFIRDFLCRDFRALVYRYSGSGEVEVSLDGKLLRLEVSSVEGFGPLSSESVVFSASDEGVRRLGSFLGLDDVSALASYALFVPNSDGFRSALVKALVDCWEDVEKAGAHFRLVRDFVAEAVDDRFTEASVKRDRLVLRKELPSGEPYYVDLEHVGAGVKRFLTAALWLEAAKPRVVLWDDLEASAHPSLISCVIRWLVERDWQVIASTHSIDVLRELLYVGPDEAKVVALRKRGDDVLTHREYSLDELEKLFNSGQNARKLLAS